MADSQLCRLSRGTSMLTWSCSATDFFFFWDDAAANAVNYFMFGYFGLTVAPRGSESLFYHNGLKMRTTLR